MKNFTKLLAVILCLVIALSTAACSMKPQWSYKEAGADEELPIGVYVYALYNAYNQARTYAQETEGYDQQTGLYGGETSFLNVKITDDDGKTAIASQWIYEEADKTMKTLLAINKEYDRLGATMDEAKAKANIKAEWTGEMYQQYIDMGYMVSDQTTLEGFGVSYESYEYFKLAIQKEQVIFDKLYEDGGEKAVPMADVTKFFEENYTSYTYFNTNLYTTDSQATENGALSSNKPMSDKEVKDNEKRYEGYVNSIKSGKSIDDIKKSFKADYKLENDTAVSRIELTKEISAGEDIKKALETLKEGEATYITVGTNADSKSLYFIYKAPIKSETEKYLKDATNKNKTLVDMKGDEFMKYIDTLTNTIKVEKSKFVGKYDVKMFEPKTEK